MLTKEATMYGDGEAEHHITMLDHVQAAAHHDDEDVEHHHHHPYGSPSPSSPSPSPSSSPSCSSSSSCIVHHYDASIASSSPTFSSTSASHGAAMVGYTYEHHDVMTMEELNHIHVRVQDPPPPPPPHNHHHQYHYYPDVADHAVLHTTKASSDIDTLKGGTKTFEIEARNVFYKPRERSSTMKGVREKVKASMKHLLGGDIGTITTTGVYPSSNHDRSGFILKGVSCVARPGEILAIVGPSGAGKSTLLEILGGRIGGMPGVFVNSKPMKPSSFRRMSGFIPQADVLSPMLTVKETLVYSARLRMPVRQTSRCETEARVEALMVELGLAHVSGCRVAQVSGGERRRVSIGVDTIHEPAVLFLDEPTSGLDSSSALHVVHMLHVMAKSRSRTIVLTIHQPGFRIIQLIQSFLLLKSGQVIHHGSLSALGRKLTSLGHVIPPHVNVLEFVMEDMLNSNTLAMSKALVADVKERGTPHPSLDTTVEKPMFANGCFHEILTLTHRFGKNVFREHSLLSARTIQASIAGLALGSLYRDVGMDSRGVAERLGFLAFMLTFLLSSSIEALPIFLKERTVLMHETSRGAYRVSSYLVAHFLVFAPFLLLIALVFSLPAYFLIGLTPTVAAFSFFVLTVWLVLLMANSFVAFFSVLVSDYIMGNSLVSGAMGAFFLFSGYFISKESMPIYWRFMHYISLFKYPLDALLINEYSSMSPPNNCLGTMTSSPSGMGTPRCSFTSEDELQSLGLDPSWKWPNIAIVIGFLVFYRILCYIVLKIKLSKITNSR